MKIFNKLIIACDGESASGKSTAAKLVSKKYKLHQQVILLIFGEELKKKNQIQF